MPKLSKPQRCELSQGMSIIWSTKSILYDTNLRCNFFFSEVDICNIVIFKKKSQFHVWKPKPGPKRHWPMAHGILDMPIAVTNCHKVLQACLFRSTGQYRHVVSRLFVRSMITYHLSGWRHGHGLQPTARAMAKIGLCVRFLSS